MSVASPRLFLSLFFLFAFCASHSDEDRRTRPSRFILQASTDHEGVSFLSFSPPPSPFAFLAVSADRLHGGTSTEKEGEKASSVEESPDLSFPTSSTETPPRFEKKEKDEKNDDADDLNNKKEKEEEKTSGTSQSSWGVDIHQEKEVTEEDQDAAGVLWNEENEKREGEKIKRTKEDEDEEEKTVYEDMTENEDTVIEIPSFSTASSRSSPRTSLPGHLLPTTRRLEKMKKEKDNLLSLYRTASPQVEEEEDNEAKEKEERETEADLKGRRSSKEKFEESRDTQAKRGHFADVFRDKKEKKNETYSEGTQARKPFLSIPFFLSSSSSLTSPKDSRTFPGDQSKKSIDEEEEDQNKKAMVEEKKKKKKEGEEERISKEERKSKKGGSRRRGRRKTAEKVPLSSPASVSPKKYDKTFLGLPLSTPSFSLLPSPSFPPAFSASPFSFSSLPSSPGSNPKNREKKQTPKDVEKISPSQAKRRSVTFEDRGKKNDKKEEKRTGEKVARDQLVVEKKGGNKKKRKTATMNEEKKKKKKGEKRMARSDEAKNKRKRGGDKKEREDDKTEREGLYLEGMEQIAAAERRRDSSSETIPDLSSGGTEGEATQQEEQGQLSNEGKDSEDQSVYTLRERSEEEEEESIDRREEETERKEEEREVQQEEGEEGSQSLGESPTEDVHNKKQQERQENEKEGGEEDGSYSSFSDAYQSEEREQTQDDRGDTIGRVAPPPSRDSHFRQKERDRRKEDQEEEEKGDVNRDSEGEGRGGYSEDNSSVDERPSEESMQGEPKKDARHRQKEEDKREEKNKKESKKERGEKKGRGGGEEKKDKATKKRKDPLSNIPLEDRVTIEDVDTPAVYPAKVRYIPRPSNPYYGKYSYATKGKFLIYPSPFPYIFDAAPPLSSSTTAVSPTSRAPPPPYSSSSPLREKRLGGKCAFFLYVHPMYPTYSAGEDPTRVPGPNGGSYESTSTLWLWQHRELQRRGEYDKVILFFPHFHASKLQSVWRRYQRRRKRKQLWRQEIEKRRRERKTKTLKEEEEDDEEEEDEDDEEGQHLGGVDSYDDAEEKKKRKAKERRSLHALPKREDQEGFLKSRLGEERYTASTTTTGEKNPFSVSSFSSSSAFSSSSPALLDVREPPLKQGIREYASWIASQLRLVLKLLLSSSSSRHQHSARKDMMDVKKKKNSSIGSSASLTDSSSLGRTPGNSSSPPNQENEEGMQEEKAYRHFSETSINKNDKEQEEQQEEEEAPPPPQLYRKQNTPAAAKDPRRRLSKEEEEMDDEDDEEGMVFFERRDLEDLRESCVHYDLHLQGWGTGGLGIRAMLSLGLLFWSNREVSFTEILQLHQLLQKYSTSSSSSSSPSSQRHPSRREERRKSSLGDEERREDTTMKKKKNTKSGRLSTSDIRRLIKKKRKKEEEEEREAEGEDEEGEKAAGEALAQKDGERQGGGEEDEEEEDKMTKKKNTIRGRREWIRSTGRQHPKQPSLHEEERRKKKSSIQNSRPLLEEKLSYHVREEKVKEDQDGNDFFLVSSSSSSSLKTVTLKTVSLIRTPHAGYGSRSDENVGLEKLGWTKWALSLVPERFYRSVGNTFYRKELLHLDSDRVLCTLAQEEKQSYSLVKKEGSLISLFHTTLYYSFLDEDYDIPVLSQIGISEGRLPMSESADILRQNPPAQNRFFYIDTNQTGLNRIDIISSPRFYPLFVDRRACTAVSLSGVYTFTLKILEVRNSRQKPSSFQPIRYLALKGEDAYDEKISLNSWKYLLFQRKRDKFERQAANRFMYIHEAVRMMQGKEAQRLSFDNDHHPTISSAWFYSQ